MSIQVDQLTTLFNVLTTLSIPDTSESTLIQLLINQLSAAILKSIRRPFVLASNPANPVTEYYGGSGDEWLILRSWPVQAPVLAGNTTQNSATVAGLPNTTYLFVNQGVVGPGIPVGTYVAAVGANQVTLSQAATATATGVPLAFDVGVWEDDTGVWGAGANSFAPTTQLQSGADFALRRDQPDGSSNSAMLCRVNDVWGQQYMRSGLALSAYTTPGQGNVKVQYWAGYTSLPPDLEIACIKSIAKARNNRLYGEAIASENFEDYSYQLANLPDVTYGLLSGEVGALLAPYRRLRQGQSL